MRKTTTTVKIDKKVIAKIHKMSMAKKSHIMMNFYKDGLTGDTGLLQDLAIVAPELLTDFKVRVLVDDVERSIVEDGWLWEDFGGNEATISRVDPNLNIIVVFPTGRIWYTRPYRLECIDNIQAKYPANFETWEHECFMTELNQGVKRWNMMKNQKSTNIKATITDIENQLDYLKSETIDKTRDLKTYRLKESQLKIEPFTLELFKKELLKIRKHAYVETAYMGQDGNIVILTKPLYAINPLDNVKGKFKIGRFYISITIADLRISIYNRDYVCVGEGGDRLSNPDTNRYYHPNIKNGEVCWGDHSSEVSSYLRDCQLFLLADFAINFLSIYPHDGGSPFIGFDYWKLHRKLKKDDSFCGKYIIPEEVAKW